MPPTRWHSPTGSPSSWTAAWCRSASLPSSTGGRGTPPSHPPWAPRTCCRSGWSRCATPAWWSNPRAGLVRRSPPRASGVRARRGSSACAQSRSGWSRRRWRAGRAFRGRSPSGSSRGPVTCTRSTSAAGRSSGSSCPRSARAISSGSATPCASRSAPRRRSSFRPTRAERCRRKVPGDGLDGERGPLERVGLALLEDLDPGRVDPGKLLDGLLVELRLDVKDPDRKVRRDLIEFALDQRGGQMAGGRGEPFESVRERALDDQGAEAAEAAGRAPEPVGGAGVTGVDEADLAVVDDEPHRRHRVVDGHRRDPEIADPLLRLLGERAEPEHGRARRGDRREVGPEHVVECVRPEPLDDRVHTRRRDRPPGTSAGERVGEKSQADHVVEVRVGQEGVLDLELLVDGQGSGHGARVDEDAVVDEERGRPLPEPLAAEGPEHLDLHWCRILAYPRASRRWPLAEVRGGAEGPRPPAPRGPSGGEPPMTRAGRRRW